MPAIEPKSTKKRCPHCGKPLPVNRSGRKNYPIAINIFCNALQYGSVNGVNLHKSAREIEKVTGIKVSPAYVKMRIQREGVAKGLTYAEFLAKYMPKGK